MEQMKSLAVFLEPDTRNEGFAKLTAAGAVPMAIEDHYEALGSVEPHAAVPVEVRSHMEAIKSLYLYGWLYYPFYTMACGVKDLDAAQFLARDGMSKYR